MSSLKQNIRSVLSEVESFLVETLKSVKLNGSAKDQKDRLLEKIRQLLDEIPGSASSQLDSNASGGSLKMMSAGGDSGSGGTTASSSSNLQSLGDEDSGYADNIPKKAVSELQNILQSGMLEKKKKSGFKTWELLYCVVSGNVMYLYKKQGDSKQKEAFCLSGYEIQEAPGLDKDASRKEMCFEVIKAGAPTYQFRAGSKEGMVIWKESIVKGIQIAADEEPGEEFPEYDDAEVYMEPSQGSCVAFHQSSPDYDDCGEEIYDELDNIPSYPAPPVPRASTLPRPPAGQGGDGGYEILLPFAVTSTKDKTKSAPPSKSSAGSRPAAQSHSASQVFAKNKAGEGHVRPSDVKREMTQTSGGVKKSRGPPPKIDIYKENGSSSSGGGESSYINIANNAQGKKANPASSAPSPAASANGPKAASGGETTTTTLPSKPRQAGQNQTQGAKSSEAAPVNKNRRSSAAALFNKNRDLPTPPAAEDKSASDAAAQSGERASPPLAGPGVGNLKRLFEK